MNLSSLRHQNFQHTVTDSRYYTVLFLARIQFMFFVGDHRVLCFGFVTKTVTNTLISAKAFLLLTLPHQ